MDAFVEKVERRLAKTHSEDSEDRRGVSFVLALASVGMGIPISAIALSGGGLAALAIVWFGIVLVNLVVARAR